MKSVVFYSTYTPGPNNNFFFHDFITTIQQNEQLHLFN